MMGSLVDNPALLRALLESNPAFRELRERNPEVNHALNDPSVLRQALEVARNPNLMREQMRSTDRALAHLDTSPEGFAALRRLYADVQAPLMEAAAPPESDAPANPFASLFSAAPPAASGGPNAEPLPNPWAPAPAAASPFSTGDAGGLGGFMNDPALFGMMGGGAMGDHGLPTLDPAQMETLISSPLMSTALEQLASNPGLVDAMASSHPGMQAMLNAHPEMRAMLSSPETLRAMANPQTLRAMAQMQAAMQGTGGLGAQLGFGAPLGLGLGAGLPPARPPAQLYATQLEQLAQMGFVDADANVAALRETGGNVHAAVERLLSRP